MKKLLGFMGSKIKEAAGVEYWKKMMINQAKKIFEDLMSRGIRLCLAKFIREYMIKRPIKEIIRTCDKHGLKYPEFDFLTGKDVCDLFQAS